MVEKGARRWKISVWILGIARLIAPLLIFYHPLSALLISMALDGIDGTIVYLAEWKWKHYHYFDKLLDFYWYCLILFYAYFSEEIRIKNAILILFAYRAVGQFLSLIFVYMNKESRILLLFPNILENYFLVYTIGRFFDPINEMFEDEYPIIPLLLAAAIAIFTEIRLHIKKKYAANYLFKIMGLDINIVWEENE